MALHSFFVCVWGKVHIKVLPYVQPITTLFHTLSRAHNVGWTMHC